MIDFAVIDRLTGARCGMFNTTCPLCSEFRHSAANRRVKIFRIWRIEHRFATYHCVHCGAKGYVRDQDSPPPDLANFKKVRAEAAKRNRMHKRERLHKAVWLWSQRKPICGSIAERYLREKRGIGCQLPATLGFLPARGEYPPALIAAFGLAHEVEPGVIAIRGSAIRGVHVTRLQPDGSDRERGEQAKIMIGHSTGSPIVLGPPNDLLGLGIAEGIENALSAHEATGLGSWAAGCSTRLPALADVIPPYIECVTLFADDDRDGRRDASTLADGIAQRGIEVRVTRPGTWRSAA
jgi:hypothetical protein